MKMCCENPECQTKSPKFHATICGECGALCAFCEHYPTVLRHYEKYIWVK